MNICRVRRQPPFTTLFALAVTAAAGVLILSGCGSGSNTYNPNVKNGAVPGFSIAVTPASVSVTQGNTANYTVTITETGGFNSAIALSASGLPANTMPTFGALTPTATGATATLAIATSDTLEAESAVALQSKLAKSDVTQARTRQVTPTGSTVFTVTGVGGGITETGTATLVVTTPPSFTVSLAPATAGSNNIGAGGTAKYTVTVTSVAGFSSPVTLSLSGVPQNANATFGATTITPTAAGATTTLSIATVFNEGAAIIPGSYTLILTGTSGSVSNSSTAGFNVGAFSITVTETTPGSGTVIQGGTAHYTVTLTAIGDFSQLATLTLPAVPTGCTATIGTLTLTPTVAGATTPLTITTTGPGSATTTPVGMIDFEVGGSGGGWTTAGSSQLNVTQAPDFTITATPTSATTDTGGSVQYTVTLTSVGGFSSPVTLSETGLPSAGTSVTFAPQTLTPTAGGVTSTITINSNSSTTPSGTFPITIKGASGSLSHSTGVSVTFVLG